MFLIPSQNSSGTNNYKSRHSLSRSIKISKIFKQKSDMFKMHLTLHSCSSWRMTASLGFGHISSKMLHIKMPHLFSPQVGRRWTTALVQDLRQDSVQLHYLISKLLWTFTTSHRVSINFRPKMEKYQHEGWDLFFQGLLTEWSSPFGSVGASATKIRIRKQVHSEIRWGRNG